MLLEHAQCELLRANLAVSGELIDLLLSKAGSKTDRAEGFRLRLTLQLLHGDMALGVLMQASFKAGMELYAEIFHDKCQFQEGLCIADRLRERRWYQVAELGFDAFMVRNALRG